MLDLDTWQEILQTVARHKLRTFLTGFSVAWGIFMLIVLLGSGQGLSNGVEHEFRDDAINSIWVFSGQTSLPHRGLQPGRQLQFTNLDHDETRTRFAEVEHSSARFYLRGQARVTYRQKQESFDVRSVHPGHQCLENTIVTAGRFVNPLDIRDHRKVAAIGLRVKRALFGEDGAIGEMIGINGIAFKVVGIFEDTGGEGEMEKIYLPISTAQRAFGGADTIAQFMVSTGEADLARTQGMVDEIKHQLAARHEFAPQDPRAVFINNLTERFQRFFDLMGGIRFFVWIVGIGTVLAGVVGVSNIMLVSVRERTKEFGIRRALGATPWSIIALILQESVLITAVAGYVGLLSGIAVLELAASQLPESSFFRQPQVDSSVAIQATLMLVLAGSLAGLVPARRAARIRPIEALRDE